MTYTYNDLKKDILVDDLLPFTKIGKKRLSNLYELCLDVNKRGIEGDFVECGIYTGGASTLMAIHAHDEDRKTWMFDSFEGMPAPTKEDGDKASNWTGKTAAGIHWIKSLLWEYDIPKNKVEIIKGWFKDTVPIAKIDKIAILRLDGDWYESTKVCLDSLYDKVALGGYIIIDDYGHWEGCQKAVDEFIEKRGLHVNFVITDYTERWWQKGE